jgi:hypothetical protein
VSHRMDVSTWKARIGPMGDVCPEPRTFGAKLRRLGRSTQAVVIDGGQGGRQAFVVDRWEEPP